MGLEKKKREKTFQPDMSEKKNNKKAMVSMVNVWNRYVVLFMFVLWL
jgi:hypothetical protein